MYLYPIASCSIPATTCLVGMSFTTVGSSGLQVGFRVWVCFGKELEISGLCC